MVTPIVVEPITFDLARPLRRQILRPNQPLEASAYPGDSAPTSLHLGALQDGTVVGTLSVFHEPPPDPAGLPTDIDHAHIWRIRGVTVLPELRGRGLAARMLERGLAYIVAQGGALVWLNATPLAVSLYQRFGFRVEREVRDDSGAYAIHFMWRAID